MIQDLPEVSLLSEQGKVRTPIRTITARPSLPPASFTHSSTGTPLRATFHFPMETMGLTTFHTSTIPRGVRLRLCAGGTTSVRSDMPPPLPRHLPFGSSLSASLACCLSRRLNSASPELAIPSNPSSRPPCEAGSRSVPSRFGCRLFEPRQHCPGSFAPRGYPRRTSRYGPDDRTSDLP